MTRVTNRNGCGIRGHLLRCGGQAVVALILVHAFIMATGRDDEHSASSERQSLSSANGAASVDSLATDRINPAPRCFEVLSVVSPDSQTPCEASRTMPAPLDPSVPEQVSVRSQAPALPPPQTRRALLQV